MPGWIRQSAFFLDRPKIRNDGVGDQKACGGQMPAAVKGLGCLTPFLAFQQIFFQGRKGQQIPALVDLGVNARCTVGDRKGR